MLVFFAIQIYIAFRFLTVNDDGNDAMKQNVTKSSPVILAGFDGVRPDDNINNGERGFVIFRSGRDAQGPLGLGNVMKGLLACYHMARTYDRTVCVDWDAFRAAFHPPHREICDGILKKYPYTAADTMLWNHGKNKRHRGNKKEEAAEAASSFPHIKSFNYPPLRERSMKPAEQHEVFASNATVVSFEGNTAGTRFGPYPTAGPNFPSTFDDLFLTPTSALADTVPWTVPPECVVHLRRADTFNSDHRRGVDEPSLRALEGREDMRGCYLITNNQEWYERFEVNAGWGHPPWSEVLPYQGAISSQMELVRELKKCFFVVNDGCLSFDSSNTLIILLYFVPFPPIHPVERLVHDISRDQGLSHCEWIFGIGDDRVGSFVANDTGHR